MPGEVDKCIAIWRKQSRGLEAAQCPLPGTGRTHPYEAVASAVFHSTIEVEGEQHQVPENEIIAGDIERGIDIIGVALALDEGDFGQAAHQYFTHNFNADEQDDAASLRGRLQAVSAGMEDAGENPVVKINDTGDQAGTAQYVDDEIRVNPGYFNREDDRRAIIMVHEFTHAILDTQDSTYEPEESLTLAMNDALSNAFNYEYFLAMIQGGTALEEEEDSESDSESGSEENSEGRTEGVSGDDSGGSDDESDESDWDGGPSAFK